MAEVVSMASIIRIVADCMPYLADLKPSMRYYMVDLHRAGGIPILLKYLLMHTDELTGHS